LPNENEKIEKPPDQDLLKLEFQECVSAGRFFVGLRFTYFFSFTTFFFILIGAFHYVWTSEAKELEIIKPVIMLAIAVFGFYTVISAMIIERRNIQLFRIADRRAAFLEGEKGMGIKDGIRQTYLSIEWTQYFWRIPVAHSVGIMMIYGAATFVWILLFLFSIGFFIYKIWLFFQPVKEVCCG